MLDDDIEKKSQMEEIAKEFDESLRNFNKSETGKRVIKFQQIERIREILTSSKILFHSGRLKSELYYRGMLNRIPKEDRDKFFYIKQESNLNQLDHIERFVLYTSWVDKYLESEKEERNKLSDDYNRSAEMLEELCLQEDRAILQDAYIVAMTTTGSSRYHSVLKDIGPRIVIVEEAAEVFESHIVASLSKHCEHLILIGDHIQLRPNPAVYVLAKHFELDVSLFERLIKNDTKKVI